MISTPDYESLYSGVEITPDRGFHSLDCMHYVVAYAFPPISLVLNENQRNGGGARIGCHSVRGELPAITPNRWNCRVVIGHSGGSFGGFSGPFRRRFGKSSGKPPKRGITSDSLSRAQTTTPNICPASAGGRSRRQKRDCLLFLRTTKASGTQHPKCSYKGERRAP